MERPSIENPEEYVKKHITKEEELLEIIPSNLSKPLFEYSFDSFGKVEVSYEEFKLSFEYKPIENLPNVDLPKTLEKLKMKEGFKQEERHSIVINSLSEKIGLDKVEVKEITELQISNGHKIWDFKKELPDCNLFIFSGGNCLIGNFDPITKNIYINSPKSALDFMSLLHESGHLITLNDVVNSEKRNEALLNYKLNFDKKILPAESYAVVLDLERTAWSYALRKISPFLKNLGVTQQEAKDFVNYALNTYKKNFGICVFNDQIVLKDIN